MTSRTEDPVTSRTEDPDGADQLLVGWGTYSGACRRLHPLCSPSLSLWLSLSREGLGFSVSSGVVSSGPLRDLEHRCPLRTILPQCSKDGESVPQPEFGKHPTRAPGSAHVVGVRLALRVWGAGNLQRDSPWDPLVLCHEPRQQYPREHACQATWASYLVSK